jgi:PAS domain S-box-containing protein
MGSLLRSRREEIIESQYEEIKKLESKYLKLYDQAPEMYRTVNTSGIIIDCNQTYVRELGYSTKEQVIGHSIFEHSAPDKIDLMRQTFDEWREKGEVKNKEVWFTRKDHTTFPVLISATSLYDNGMLVGSNSVIINETELYNARKQLQEASEKIRRAAGLQDEFVRIAAHELRTPIQTILLMAGLGKSGKVGTSEQSWDVILREAKRLKELTDDILDVTRIESGALSYHMQNCNLGDILNEISKYAQMTLQAQRKEDRVKIVSISDVGDLQVTIDSDRIIQALRNVINNAIKLTEAGKIVIEAVVFPDRNAFEIRVADTGPGIHNEVLPKLFGKFVTRSDGHGTGIGLFISKSIVEAHGGQIRAINNPGSIGATFFIKVPVSKSK